MPKSRMYRPSWAPHPPRLGLALWSHTHGTVTHNEMSSGLIRPRVACLQLSMSPEPSRTALVWACVSMELPRSQACPGSGLQVPSARPGAETLQ